ncbi:mannose-1-phosphate guanylyltransferase/mannose-6-phosphate isomerase [Burkholderiaceae bacterium]|nr:mannose-1-phosphate guanylyltransferase/mannose-6-phosphate isomerase [Burkholderiaceae bacterium]
MQLSKPPHQVIPVILCGGTGTRLWPLSRAGFPKQFLSLTGQESLFQQAVMRAQGLAQDDVNVLAPVVVAGDEHRFLVIDQLREVGVDQATMLLEPVGRNTAPALTLAALAATETGEDPILVVTPADQHIPDSHAFNRSMNRAITQAALGHIVTLGIQPTRPETGFGYIQVSESVVVAAADEHGDASGVALDVLSFLEKPNLDEAQAYVAQGCYLWNSGMFVLKASVWLSALQSFRPDIAAATQSAWGGRRLDNMSVGRFVRPDPQAFALVPAESIDYAVMEHSPGSGFTLKMVGFTGTWSDLGAWDGLWDHLTRDEVGNASKGDVFHVDSQNNLVYATGRLVGMVGVNNLVVVETPDAVLVSTRQAAQNVKHLVQQLQAKGRQETLSHRKVHRPWGWYDCIEEGERFKVKRIHVKPGGSLSLQKHHHRTEHWIVVVGTAEVTNGDQVMLLTENQSTYIPLGQVHRLVNPGSIALEMIEVQSGSYLGEDDIVRLKDEYGRNE